MDIKQIDKNTGTSYAKGRQYFDNLFKTGNIPNCSPGYISGACGNGHKFAAPFLCGKEYCKECGQDGSPIHARRVARWQAITGQFKKLGYLVFTFPEKTRFLFQDRKILADFRYQLRRKLTRDGYDKGLARWHFFGDCEKCNNQGCQYCNNTGAGTHWHPHLNVFIDCGYMDNLQQFTNNYSNWVKNYLIRLLRKEEEKRTLLIEKYGKALDKLDSVYSEIEELTQIIAEQEKTKYVINFSYTSDKKKIINRLKYVTRSTFRVFNTEVKEIIHNFRNSVRWGIKPDKTPITPHECPECKEPVKFYGLERYTPNLTYKNYGKTVYQLSSPGGSEINHRIKAPPGRNNRKITKINTGRTNNTKGQQCNFNGSFAG